MVAQRLRNVQEVIAEREYLVGSFYISRGALAAASNRLQGLTDHYALYSKSPDALLKLGDTYNRMPVARFKKDAIAAWQRIVREYPLAPEVAAGGGSRSRPGGDGAHEIRAGKCHAPKQAFASSGPICA